jgi:uncharacterized protein
MRRSMRDAVKRDGEVLSLPKLRRKLSQRRILLLIDVSGSMKAHTDGSLRFAHAMARVSDRLEVFTVGTRLTRITRAMRLVNRDQALAAAAGDGGRLGRRHPHRRCAAGLPLRAALCQLRPRRLVLILSDGLERGDPCGDDAIGPEHCRGWPGASSG